jgi:FtsP/CotA-like multicopper oxidase with cupredoxin domain
MTEMPVLASDSRTGVLDVLMIAKPKAIQLTGRPLTAWVYEICRRATAVNDRCPAGSSTLSPYGGVRLQLQPGDHLRIRLINQLPPAPPDAEHAYDSDPMGEEMLQANPTNLHTHGLIVEPRKADKLDPTYGDYVYILGYPSGKMPKMAHPGLVYTDKAIDYDIYIPKNHPSGLYWFHPHVHGLSLNQISEGMAGLITIGSPSDYLGDRRGVYGLHDGVTVRHLLLKDIEVEKDGSVLTQEDPDFCDPDPGPMQPVRPGWCGGVLLSSDGGSVDHTGGRWIFSVSGQVFPSETLKGKGEIWRIASGSGSRGYSLVIRDDDTGGLLPFQVLSLDGVSIDSTGQDTSGFAARVGDRIRQVPCSATETTNAISHPVCATGLKMMPSARMEIWVPSRIGASKHATFMTQSLSTGPEGDDWPSVGLVRMTFAGSDNASTPSMLEVRPFATEMGRGGGILASAAMISVPGMRNAMSPDAAGRMPQFAEHVASLADANCKALAPGHTRRIYFGVPTGAPDAFGLGYEELDEKGRGVPGSFKDIEPFDHLSVTVCLPLAAGNRPVTERWELVNVAGEDHNFHIHQTRFRVLPANAPAGDASGVMDNVPVLHGGPGCDGSIASFRRGACVVAPVRVEIPFAEIGDFVYHCHILEHEDGGMMAHIRVVAHH